MAGFPSGKYVDPQYLAELQAQQRGLSDLLQDTSIERKRLKQDTKTQIGDIRTDKKRGLTDIGLERERGKEDIGFQRQDVKREDTRGTEDFGTRLNNLITDFQQMGRQQAMAGNAAGLTGGSYSQAAAAARAAQFSRQRQPIDTGLSRLHEDTATQLGRLDVSKERLLSDTGREEKYLTQDTHHDIKLAKRGKKRGLKDILIERQRGRREMVFSERDLSRQASFGANLTRRSMNPYAQ